MNTLMQFAALNCLFEDDAVVVVNPALDTILAADMEAGTVSTDVPWGATVTTAAPGWFMAFGFRTFGDDGSRRITDWESIGTTGAKTCTVDPSDTEYEDFAPGAGDIGVHEFTLLLKNPGGAISAYSHFYRDVIAASSGLIDGLSTAPVAAYSLKQLRDAETVAANVRESGGDTDANIGFASGEFDASAFTSHVGANTGYINTLPDQSVSGYDMAQATDANQMRIQQDAGGTYLFNGNEDNARFLANDALYTAMKSLDNLCIIAAVEVPNAGGNGQLIFGLGRYGAATVEGILTLAYDQPNTRIEARIRTTDALLSELLYTVTPGNKYVLRIQKDRTAQTFKLFVDGTERASQATGNFAMGAGSGTYDHAQIGNAYTPTSTYAFQGEIESIMCFTSIPSSEDISTIEAALAI